MPESRSRKRSNKGDNRASSVLDSAERVLVEQGYRAFSMRKVASDAGMTLGNLQYYFPTKESLTSSMLNRRISAYLEWFDDILTDAGEDPRIQFSALIEQIFLDLNRKQTTMFFPEVWSLANHDDRVVEHMDAMYARYRAVLATVIGRVNPRLKMKQRDRLALFFSASIEGHTVFVGHGKPWKRETAVMLNLARESFLHLIDKADVPSG